MTDKGSDAGAGAPGSERREDERRQRDGGRQLRLGSQPGGAADADASAKRAHGTYSQ